MLRFVPILGIYVYPGDDAKMHSLLAKLIVENNGYPLSWGNYAPPSEAESPVVYPVGFHSIIAFVFYIIGGRIPLAQLTLIITQIYNLLIVLSTYYLAKQLLNKTIGITSALVLGLVSPIPLLFFWWGGNAELAANFIFLTLASILLLGDYESTKKLILIMILLAGIFYINVLTGAITLILVLLPLTVSLLVKGKTRSLRNILIAVGGAITLFLSYYYRSIYVILTPYKQAFIDHFSYIWWQHDQLLARQYITQFYSLSYIFDIMYKLLGLVPLLALFGLVFLWRRNPRVALLLIYWLAFLLLLHINGPNGVFFIKFPGWYIFVPGRMLLHTIYPLSILAGSFLASLIPVKNANVKKSKRILAWLMPLLAISLLVNITFVNNYIFMIHAREDSPVTENDILAFRWIQENIPSTATFFVTDADAGQWIPVFTGRRVIPSFINFQGEAYVNMSFWNEVITISEVHISKLNEALLSDPESNETLYLLRKYGINYVYIGNKCIYDRVQLNPNALILSPHYELVYYKSGVYIFKIRYEV